MRCAAGGDAGGADVFSQLPPAGRWVRGDDAVRAAQQFAARGLKLVVEPGGAVALAALLAGKIAAAGKVLGVVLSGGMRRFRGFSFRSLPE